MPTDPIAPDDEIESIDFGRKNVEQLRAECRTIWSANVKPPAEWWPLRGGPADGEQAPRYAPTFSGNWVNDKGDVVMLTYEWVKEGDEWYGEFAGMKNTRLLADEVVEDQMSQERGEAEPEMVDLEKMTTEEALAFLKDDNERRITELFELSNGQIELDRSADLDLACVRIFVKRILLFISPKMHVEAELEYENHRSRYFDEIEDKFTKFQDEREKALAQARLSMQGPPPGMGPPGSEPRIAFSPRRVRRAN